MAEAELTKTIRYIEEREKSLSRYSDKLRRAVERIFNVFGKPSECQVCGYGETRYLHFKYYYYPDECEEYHTCYSVTFNSLIEILLCLSCRVCEPSRLHLSILLLRFLIDDGWILRNAVILSILLLRFSST